MGIVLLTIGGRSNWLGIVGLNYRRDAGTDWVDTSGATWDYYVHLDLPTGEWNRVEQDIAADIQRLTPAVQYQSAHGVWLWGRDFRIDDIRFSNSMTTERNSLLPGSIGQVAYRERWEGTGGSPTPTYGGSARGGGQRRWNSYNHIGNVVGISNASGYFVEAVNTDAFGNPLASTQTGEWASGLGGNRGLTTKELDPAAGMYYFYQRWYDPQTATFASRAPFPPDVEHPYQYAWNEPVINIDPNGTYSTDGCCEGLDLPSADELTSAIKQTIDSGAKYWFRSIKRCLLRQAERITVRCRGQESYGCRVPNVLAHTARGNTWRPHRTMTLCTERLTNCGKQNLTDIIIHEMAHTCGMPHEGAWKGSAPPPPWAGIGIPATDNGGHYACDGN